MRPLLYLAAPYTHKFANVRQERLQTFCEVAAKFERRGEYHVVSGLYNTLLTSHDAELPDDYAFWQSYSRTMLSHSKVLVVLVLPGWQLSTGVKDEIAFAHEHHIPTVYYDPAQRSLNTEPPEV